MDILPMSTESPQAHEIRIQFSVTPSSPPTSPSGPQAHEIRIKILVPPSSPPTSPSGPQASEISETQSSLATSLSSPQASENTEIQSRLATSPSDPLASGISEIQSDPQAFELEPSDPQASEPEPSDPQAQPVKTLYDENRELAVELYTAALHGEWETFKSKLGNDHGKILCSKITIGGETGLHVAAGARQTEFVKKLMNLREMTSEYSELLDKNDNTAFCLAALAGAKPIVESMINKYENLPNVPCNKGATPLYMAALYGQGDMVRFLEPKTTIREEEQTKLFFTYVDIGLFDLAFNLLVDVPMLAVTRNEERGTALHMLARKPSAFLIKSPGKWKTFINSWKTLINKYGIPLIHKRKLNQIDPALQLVRCLWENVLKDKVQNRVRDDSEILNIIKEPSPLLFEAAKLGNFKFLAELVRLYPNLMWQKDDNQRTIFHFALLNRHASIFNQIHNIGSIKDFIAGLEDGSRNNVLHLAANKPLQSRLNEVSGAALQMQQELIWFEEVEKIVLPSYREKKNSDGYTPRELFTESHETLLKDGESWMKSRAKSCMLVATIITSVVFAAALALPKRIDDSVKTPNLSAENWFQVFTMSDGIAFSFSLFSIIIFLSLLTSRYRENAFRRLLPFKLMAGLLTLFISMISMMLAFTAAFIVAYDRKKRWAPILISATAFLPAAIFVGLQCSLFLDVFKSTLSSKCLFQPSELMICKQSHRSAETV